MIYRHHFPLFPFVNRVLASFTRLRELGNPVYASGGGRAGLAPKTLHDNRASDVKSSVQVSRNNPCCEGIWSVTTYSA